MEIRMALPARINNYMEEARYQNRELDEKFANLRAVVVEKHDDVMVKVNEVLVQAKYTNGKVRKIIVTLVLIGGVLIGQSFANMHDIIALLISVF